MTDPLTSQAPHVCPECSEPAYLGFGVPCRCSNRECVFFCQELWADHVMALPDEEVGQEFDIEDEDTQPYAQHFVPGKIVQYNAPALTPGQLKAMKIIDDAIDKMPVPYILTDWNEELRRAQQDLHDAETAAGVKDASDRLRKAMEELYTAQGTGLSLSDYLFKEIDKG